MEKGNEGLKARSLASFETASGDPSAQKRVFLGRALEIS